MIDCSSIKIPKYLTCDEGFILTPLNLNGDVFLVLSYILIEGNNNLDFLTLSDSLLDFNHSDTHFRSKLRLGSIVLR